MATKIALFAGLLVATAIADAPPRLFNAGYLGSGLNLLSADVNVFDPAQFGAPVFNLSWTQGLTTDDGRWSIPDNSYARGYPACEFDASTTKITNTFDYQNWLTESVSTHSSFFDIFSGSSSSSYSLYSELTYDSMKYIYMAHALCSTYQLAYKPFSQQTLSADFITGVNTLPAKFGPESLLQYFKFISYFGTSVIKSLTMGGRMITNILLDATSFQVLSSQDISCDVEAGISFLIDAGVDAHGEDKTDKHIAFSKVSEQQALKCMGGDPGNCSFASWAPSVPSNPVPVAYDLDDLASLLTVDYFPGDPDIASKQAGLRAATRLFVQTNGSVPQSYCADVSNQPSVQSHAVSLMHLLDAIPTFVQIQYTQTVDRTYSTFFPLEWAHDPAHSGNFISLDITEQEVVVGTNGPSNLAGFYDSTSGQWASSPTGYWTAASIARAPAYGGQWVPVSNGRQEVVLAQGFNSSNITLVQVQFAETSQPTRAFPLVWRWADTRAQGTGNPFAITMEDGVLALQFDNGPVFPHWTPAGWTQFNSGFFRACLFTLAPDFDSGWITSPPVGQSVLFDVPHGLDVVPQIVQVFFSPDRGVRVYPVAWNFDVTSTPNPVSISVDRHVVTLSLLAGASIFNSWHAETQVWSSFTTGSWRITAFLDPTLINGQ